MNSQIKRFENFYEQTSILIGQGVFAQVYLGKRKSSGEPVAIKISNSNSPISQKEKEILTQISKYSHPQVISILDIFDQGNQLYIVQEYCKGGTLYDLMLQNPQLSEEYAVEVISQVAEGLSFLHGINIVHGDIKPENILKQITKEGKEVFKITDFGLSSIHDQSNIINSKVGTAYYVAPEFVNGRAEREGYDKSVDTWALGLMLDELLHGSPFFNGSTEEDVFMKIRNDHFFIRTKEYREASFFETTRFIIQQVLINMIQVEPSLRKELTWVIDQLGQYKQLRRKVSSQSIQSLQSIQSMETKKTNKQIFTESMEKHSIADELFDFLNHNFPQPDSQQTEQKFQISNDISPKPSNKGIIHQIQQKYQKTIPDEQEQICYEHRLPAKFRMPRSQGIVTACTMCLRVFGIYESETLQKLVDESIQVIKEQRFESLYHLFDDSNGNSTSDSSDKLPQKRISDLNKFISGSLCQTSELEVRDNGTLNVRVQEMCEEGEIKARQLVSARLKELEQFRVRGYRGEEAWVNATLMKKSEENVLVSELKKDLQNISEGVVKECQALIQDRMMHVMRILREKLSSNDL